VRVWSGRRSSAASDGLRAMNRRYDFLIAWNSRRRDSLECKIHDWLWHRKMERPLSARFKGKVFALVCLVISGVLVWLFLQLV